MLVGGLTINRWPKHRSITTRDESVKYDAKAHLMLMSGLYFVHRLRSPHSNGVVGKAAISAASWVDTWQGIR